MSNTQLKPTDEEIAEYIYMWIESFDGDGLIIEDDKPILKALKETEFSMLRSMFAPVMYNSIEEWKENN